MELNLLTSFVLFGVMLSANAQLPIYVNQLGNLGYGGLGGFGQSAGYGYNNKYGVGGVGATGTNSYSAGLLPLFLPPIIPPPIIAPPPIIQAPPSYGPSYGPSYRSGPGPMASASTSVSSSSNAVPSGVVPQTVQSQPLSSRRRRK